MPKTQQTDLKSSKIKRKVTFYTFDHINISHYPYKLEKIIKMYF